VSFGYAVMTERLTGLESVGTQARQWTAAQASADSVSVVGVDGLGLSGSDLSLEINRASNDGILVDFAAQTLAVPVGSGRSDTTCSARPAAGRSVVPDVGAKPAASSRTSSRPLPASAIVMGPPVQGRSAVFPRVPGGGTALPGGARHGRAGRGG